LRSTNVCWCKNLHLPGKATDNDIEFLVKKLLHYRSANKENELLEHTISEGRKAVMNKYDISEPTIRMFYNIMTEKAIRYFIAACVHMVVEFIEATMVSANNKPITLQHMRDVFFKQKDKELASWYLTLLGKKKKKNSKNSKKGHRSKKHK
jgi:hypothetical protein